MTCFLIEEARAVDHRAALLVGGAEYHPRNAGVADRAGAHNAGLQGDKQSQALKPIVLRCGGRRAQGEDFGVGGGIAHADRGVASLGDDPSTDRIQDHRANWRLTLGGRGLRLGQGDVHGGEVMVGHSKHETAPAALGQGSVSPPGERVAKRLARAGVASRREIERLIAAGKVALNGQILATPAVNVGPADVLTVDGVVVGASEPTRLFRYHKPAGLVTTHRDPKGRATVFDALPADLPRVISVGRLDLMSEGLLLLTNDGGLSRALELPSNGWMRRYRARARGRIDQGRLDRLADGLTVEGVRYGAITATLDQAREGPPVANLWITLSLSEGKNREVRRVLEALGLAVNRLIRVAYGPFALGSLEPGAIEEVGPDAIREHLAHVIAPANLPAGDRVRFKAVSHAPASRRTPAAKSAKPEAQSPMLYKPGWAKPRKKLKAAIARRGKSRKSPP